MEVKDIKMKKDDIKIFQEFIEKAFPKNPYYADYDKPYQRIDWSEYSEKK